jgi:hypothetical protein
MAHKRINHEFGVPDENINFFAAPGDRETAEIPLPEIRNFERQRLTAQEQLRLENEDAFNAAELKAVEAELRKISGIGVVVKPAENTLQDYKYILREGKGARDIIFSPFDYKYFDGIIVEMCGVDKNGRPQSAPFNPDKENEYYEDYAPLRRNIAILRNYLLVPMLADGRTTTQEIAIISQMAEKLGDALSGGNPKLNFMQRWLNSAKKLVSGQDMKSPDTAAFLEAANIPDKGIAVMYDYLLGLQHKPNWRDLLPFNKKITPKSWNLQPRGQTAFSEENIQLYGRGSSLLRIAVTFDKIVTKPVDSLSNEDKKVSIDHARDILEKLKVFFGSRDDEVTLSPMADPKRYESILLLRAALAYKGALSDALKAKPGMDIFGISELQFAKNALQEISYRMKIEAVNALMQEGNTEQARAMIRHLQSIPLVNKSLASLPINNLIAKLEIGFNKIEEIAGPNLGKARGLGVSPASIKDSISSAVTTGAQTLSNASIRQATNNVSVLEQARQANERQGQNPENIGTTYVGKNR